MPMYTKEWIKFNWGRFWCSKICSNKEKKLMRYKRIKKQKKTDNAV